MSDGLVMLVLRLVTTEQLGIVHDHLPLGTPAAPGANLEPMAARVP
jgi:hypothetical protein